LNGGTFISYVDPPAVAERIALVHALGLRGAFAWEVSNDDNANDLVNALSH
jgi:chitinase